MQSQEGEEPSPNSSQSDSRLKSKKPPSLVIAIPAPEEEERTETVKQPLRSSLKKSESLQQASPLSDSGTDGGGGHSAGDRRAAFYRQTSLSQSIRKGTAQATAQAAGWFGVGENCETEQQLWQKKSLRHCSQRYGKLKAQYREPELPVSMDQGLDSPAANKMPKVGYRTHTYIWRPL
ncbi:hypothetical protein J4Q44_G00284650, partial [Coregonus suidteri]